IRDLIVTGVQTCALPIYRNFETAEKIFDRAIEAAPQSLGPRAEKAKLALDWKGDLSVMEKELTQLPAGVDPDGLVTFSRVQLLLDRKSTRLNSSHDQISY